MDVGSPDVDAYPAGITDAPTPPDVNEAIAALCHRVRTPLNGILGTLELLLATSLDDDAHELARVAYDSALALHLVFEGDVGLLQGELLGEPDEPTGPGPGQTSIR